MNDKSFLSFMAVLALLLGTSFAEESTTASPVTVLLKFSPPFAMQNEQDQWKGVSVDLWESIAKECNIPFLYREASLQQMLDQVTNREAFIAIPALSVTLEREKQMDFSHIYFSSRLGFLTPVEERPWWQAIEPFFSLTFLRVLGALALVILSFGVLMWIFERKHNEQFGGAAHHGIGAAFWWSAVTITTVGYGDKSPVTFMGRVVGLIWMFTGLILISGFTAAIASSVTTYHHAHKKASTLGDLHQINVVAIRHTTAESYLERVGVHCAIVNSSEEAMMAIHHKKADAFVYDVPSLRYLAKGHPTSKFDITTLEEAPVQRYAFALPEKSPHLESINRALLKVLESPHWNKINREYLGE